MRTTSDSTTIWVSPAGSDKGPGTFDEPYGSVGRALQRVRPGYTILLKEGRYRGDLTVQVSGTIRAPIRIAAAEGAEVEVSESSWFFYDVSDLIVSGITFRGAPNVAVSVIGRCERNCLRQLRFVSGDATGKVPCTMYFGGSGARHNVVEHCRFEVPSDKQLEMGRIGIMVAEGDDQEGALPNKKHVFRRNAFVNYGCGIMVGSRDIGVKHYGHVVEDNVVEGRGGDGIRVRCGDTVVRGNRLAGCGGIGIALIAGRGSTVENNRIMDCGTGIRVSGTGHSVRDNLLLRCRREAVHAAPLSDDLPLNNIVENNTCVDCGGEAVAGLRLDAAAGCIVRKNVFFGTGEPYLVEGDQPSPGRRGGETLFIDDNLAGGGCSPAAGCSEASLVFADPGRQNYENDTDYGARGWAAGGVAPRASADASAPLVPQSWDDDEGSDSTVERLLTDVDRDELIGRSLFFGQEELPPDEEDPE